MAPYINTPPSESETAITSVAAQNRAWWKEVSVYQIYPASYADSNGDGIGDLRGIIEKVPYMHRLGVDCVWLSPIMQSPQKDMGYDISDYEVIDTQYGHISDVDELIARLHGNGMKLIMDLVVNHTSTEHEWFKQSKSSKDNYYRNWYFWRKGRVDENGVRHPPNNWRSDFQGSAWEYDETTDEYYLHLFAKEQADLNWDHPPVREAVHKIIRFWLDRGVDGFRMDVINFISKVPDLPDAHIVKVGDPWQNGGEYYAAGPRLHEYLAGIGAILNEYGAFSVGEMPCVSDPKEVIKSVRHDRGELNMIFNFDHVDLDHGPGGKFTPREFKLTELKAIVNKWQTFMYAHDGWNALYLENHDQPRSVSRYASDAPEHIHHSSTMLAIFMGCQAGTPFVYQGQELGMTNVPKSWGMEEYKDVDCVNHWDLLNSMTQDPERLEEAKREYQKKARDNARTPMQWSGKAPHGGFTQPGATPWMTANPNHVSINAESQLGDSKSTFNFWRRMLEQRKKHKDVLVYGGFQMREPVESEELVVYERRDEVSGQMVLVICNFSAGEVEWAGRELAEGKVKDVVLSNYGRVKEHFEGGKVVLEPYEGFALLVV
jgi:glycosidase